MKILVVAFHPSESTFGWVTGGSERKLLATMGQFQTSGHIIHVLEPLPPMSSQMGYHYTTIPVDLKMLRLRGSLAAELSFFEWVPMAVLTGLRSHARHRYDAIYVHNGTIHDLAVGFILSRLTGLPTIVVVHWMRFSSLNPIRNFIQELRDGTPLLSSLLRALGGFIETRMNFAGSIICVSRSTASQIKSLGFDTSKLAISGSGLGHLARYADKEPLDQRKLQALYVGRLHGSKGLLDLMKIWSTVVEKIPKASLELIGGKDSQDEATLLQIKKSSAVKDIHLRGYVSDDELVKFYQESKVFVFPCSEIGWGLAVAEALSFGIPTVAYAIPALKENFAGCKALFWVKKGDVKEFARWTIEVLRANPEHYRQLSVDAKNYSTRFDWSSVARIELETIERLVCENRERHGKQ